MGLQIQRSRDTRKQTRRQFRSQSRSKSQSRKTQRKQGGGIRDGSRLPQSQFLDSNNMMLNSCGSHGGNKCRKQSRRQKN